MKILKSMNCDLRRIQDLTVSWLKKNQLLARQTVNGNFDFNQIKTVQLNRKEAKVLGVRSALGVVMGIKEKEVVN